MRISIDEDRCEGHGRCYALAPDLFEPDDLGYAHVIADRALLPGDLDAARRAVANCPEQAISLEETSTDE